MCSEGLPAPCFVDDIFLAVFSHSKRNSETFQSTFCKGIRLIQEGVHHRLTKASFPNPCTSVIRCQPMDLVGDTNVHSTTEAIQCYISTGNLRVVFEFAVFSSPWAKPSNDSSLPLAHLIVLCLFVFTYWSPLCVSHVCSMPHACGGTWVYCFSGWWTGCDEWDRLLDVLLGPECVGHLCVAQYGYGTSGMPLLLSISYGTLQTLWLPDLPGDALLRENLIFPKLSQVAQDLQVEPGSIWSERNPMVQNVQSTWYWP